MLLRDGIYKVWIHGFELPLSGTNGNLRLDIQCGIRSLSCESYN